MVEFATFSADEETAVECILNRASGLAHRAEVRFDGLTLRMDLSAVHAHTPLRLVELSETDDFTFAHDVFGIQRHMDRDTGVLTGCFRPRLSR